MSRMASALLAGSQQPQQAAPAGQGPSELQQLLAELHCGLSEIRQLRVGIQGSEGCTHTQQGYGGAQNLASDAQVAGGQQGSADGKPVAQHGAAPRQAAQAVGGKQLEHASRRDRGHVGPVKATLMAKRAAAAMTAAAAVGSKHELCGEPSGRSLKAQRQAHCLSSLHTPAGCCHKCSRRLCMPPVSVTTSLLLRWSITADAPAQQQAGGLFSASASKVLAPCPAPIRLPAAVLSSECALQKQREPPALAERPPPAGRCRRHPGQAEAAGGRCSRALPAGAGADAAAAAAETAAGQLPQDNTGSDFCDDAGLQAVPRRQCIACSQQPSGRLAV